MKIGNKQLRFGHRRSQSFRLMMFATGALAGVLVLNSLPDLIRYIKIERM